MQEPHRRALLLVEDERIIAKDLQSVLRYAGYEVAIAASCDEAVARAEERRPDLAIMDIRILGPRDGVETAQLLGERFGVRVIYLSANIDGATRQRAEATRPLGYLQKPVTASALREAIANGLAVIGSTSPTPTG